MLSFILATAIAAEVSTNSVHMIDAPKWINAARINRVADRIERTLEWDIRRVKVKWHSSTLEFQKAVDLPGDTSSILAVAKRQENAVHLGPKVTNENFDGIFGHELAHIIMFQKYKDAIPKWLEEGLANYAAKRGTIDYKYLASQPETDVRSLSHPFKASAVEPKYHYMASSAVMEMIASKCRIHDLLQLSVGQTLEGYLATYCKISDLNADFKKWIQRKQQSSAR